MIPIKLNEIASRVPNVDLFICSISFENRCFSFINSAESDVFGRIWFAYNENEKEFYEENIQIAKSYKNSEFLKFSTDDPILTSKTLLGKFQALPLMQNLLVDISTFTHEGLLILFKFINVFKEKFSKINLVYVGAKEYSTNVVNDSEKWLSKGTKSIRSVLGYPGIINPSYKNHLIILFGFESERTSKLIESFEFDKVSIGIGPESDSIQNSHYKINRKRHVDLLKTYPFVETFEFSLTDPFEAKSQIEFQISKYENYNVVITPLNNKLSAIGAALVASDNPKVQLCYVRAHEYNYKAYSIPSDSCYLVKIL